MVCFCSLKDIYPPELQLNLEGYLDQLSSLDLDLKKCETFGGEIGMLFFFQ